MSRPILVTIQSLVLAAALALVPVASPAVAQDGPISVNVNMARVLRIASPAATVIIGNPGIADVTIQDPTTLVLTGKSFGETNIIVLDSVGNPIADTIVRVVQSGGDTVTIYQGLKRTSVACAPVCQPIIMLGDDPEFTTNTLNSSVLVGNSAGR